MWAALALKLTRLTSRVTAPEAVGAWCRYLCISLSRMGHGLRMVRETTESVLANAFRSGRRLMVG